MSEAEIQQAARQCLLDIASDVHEWIETRRYALEFATAKMEAAEATILRYLQQAAAR